MVPKQLNLHFLKRFVHVPVVPVLDLVDGVHQHLTRQYDGDRVLIHVRLPQRHLGPLHEEGTTFRQHAPFSSLTPLPASEPIAPAAVEDVA